MGMPIVITFMLLILVSPIAYLPVDPDDLQEEMMGNNVLINGDFQTPNLATTLKKEWTNFNNSTMVGWKCLYFCEVDDMNVLPPTPVGVSSNSQSIDMNSYYKLEILSQTITIPPGTYLFQFQVGYPRFNPFSNKTIYAYINNVLQMSWCSSTIDLTHRHVLKMYYQNNINNNTVILFNMSGNNDGSGPMLDNVNVRMIKSGGVVEQLTLGLLNSYAIRIINGIPGNRVIFNYLFGFFPNFDRLQYYIYHHHNYSYFALLIINQTNYMQMQKGMVVERWVNVSLYLNWLSVDYKLPYSDELFIKVNPNGKGFWVNCGFVLVCYFGGSILIVVVFLIIFQGMRQCRVSLLVRKYCFGSTVFLLLFEGNTEQFSFYFFSELQLFFSFQFKHKVFNALLLLFSFVLVFYAFGSFFWFKSHYGRRLIKYYISTTKKNVKGISAATASNAMWAVFLGAAHTLLLNSVNLQLIVLAIIEIMFISISIYFMARKCFIRSMIVWINIMASLLRISYQITFYYYNTSCALINEIHRVLLLCYLILWITNMLMTTFSIVRECCKDKKDQEHSYVKLKDGKQQIDGNKKKGPLLIYPRTKIKESAPKDKSNAPMVIKHRKPNYKIAVFKKAVF